VTMKWILTRLMTAAAVIGMLATVPHVKAADPIKIVALSTTLVPVASPRSMGRRSTVPS
jgi:hypothetical protein